jgi:hypothetical protein
MKKIQFFLVACFFTSLSTSCQKEQNVAEPKPNKFSLKNFIAAYYSGLNDEGKRILDAIADYDHSVAVTDNPNFGVFSRLHPESDIYTKITIKLRNKYVSIA